MLILRGLLAILLAAAAAGAGVYFAFSYPHLPELVLLLAVPLAAVVFVCVVSPSWLTPPIFVGVFYGFERLIVSVAAKPMGVSVSQWLIEGTSSAMAVPVGVAVLGWVALGVYRKIGGYGSKPFEPMRGSHLAGVIAVIGIATGIGLMIGAPDPIGGLLLCLLLAVPAMYWLAWRRPAPALGGTCKLVAYLAGATLAASCLWALLFYIEEGRRNARDEGTVAALIIFGLQIFVLDRLRRHPRLLAGWAFGVAAGVVIATVGYRSYGFLGTDSWLTRAAGKPTFAVIAVGLIAGPLLGLPFSWYWHYRSARANADKKG